MHEVLNVDLILFSIKINCIGIEIEIIYFFKNINVNLGVKTIKIIVSEDMK